MLIDRENISRHFGWLGVVILATSAAVAWYTAEFLDSGRLPGGASLPGLVFGTVSGVIILFEFLLWPRKHFRRFRWGMAKTWLKAHIWLGLLTVPCILLHSGFQWGGQLSSLLAVVFILVILSGIFGLVMQQWLPKKMLAELPAETVASQAENVARRLYLDAEQTMAAVCGFEPHDSAAWRGADAADAAMQSPSLAVRQLPTTDLTRQPHSSALGITSTQWSEPVPGSEPLKQAFIKVIGPFLWCGDRRNVLGDPSQAGVYFGQLRAALDPAVHSALAILESYCEQRRQFERQLRWHRWLHGWLLIHLPLSVVLIVLMLVHAFTALKYR